MRLRLQRILLTVKAACSRSVYTRELVRGVLHDPVWDNLPGSDPQVLLSECEALGLELCVAPCTDLTEAVVHERWLRHDLQPPITVVSDGAAVQRGIGFAVVLIDVVGVAAHFWCHVTVADPTSWVAEWLGRALSVEVLRRYSMASALLLGDNLSAAVNEGLQKPTPSHYVNVLIRYVAQLLLPAGHVEGYVPSQHTTGWRHLIAQAQAKAHELASVPPHGPLPVAVPFLSVLKPHSVLLQHGALCINPQSVLQSVYDASIFPSSSLPPLCFIGFRCSSWGHHLTELQLTNDEIRVCLWIRSHQHIRSSPPTAYCPFCEQSVGDWAAHFSLECLRLWVAVASAFQALLAELIVLGWSIEQESVHAATAVKGSERLPVRVVVDGVPQTALGVL